MQPKVSIRGEEFIIAVPLQEIAAIASNCPVTPAEIMDAAAFCAYVVAWLEKNIDEVKDAAVFATHAVVQDAAYMGAGIQLVTPPDEQYIDRMWADDEGGMVQPRGEAFQRVYLRYGPTYPA